MKQKGKTLWLWQTNMWGQDKSDQNSNLVTGTLKLRMERYDKKGAQDKGMNCNRSEQVLDI